jgi:hypothetical protein
MEKPVLSPEARLRDLNRLRQPQLGTSGLSIDQAVFQTRRHYRPIVRGQAWDVEESAAERLDGSNIYKWAEQDPAGFIGIAGRDPDIRGALASIRHLIESLQDETIDPSDRTMRTLALGERIAEIDILASPYIPKSAKAQIESGIKEEAQKEEVAFEGQEAQARPLGKETLADKFIRLFSKIRFPMPGLPGEISESPAKEQKDSLDEEESGEKTQKRESAASISQAQTRHPLLDSSTATGRERGFRERFGKKPLVQVDNDLVEAGGFVITKVYTSYDPKTGRLDVPRDKKPYKSNHSSDWGRKEVRAFIGRIDPSSIKTLGVPRIVKSSDSRSQQVFDFGRKLSDISIAGRDGKLLPNYLINPYLIRIDSAGNITIEIGEMPEEERVILEGQELVITAGYVSNREDPSFSSLIGPMPEDEKFRLNLYPPEISNLIQVLLEKKRNGIFRYGENLHIFDVLAKFLGTYALTYDFRDAKRDKDDPVGFNQTERVFARGLASCEGANIALGQIMRYFLDEGEGIGYVAGFETSGGTGTGRNYHLEVLYVDKYGRKHLLDATPWLPDSKKSIDANRNAYKRAKKRVV